MCEERDVLVCMSKEQSNPVEIARTVAAFTDTEHNERSTVVVYIHLERMEQGGLVKRQEFRDPKVLPLFKLTAKGLAEKAKALAEQPSIASLVRQAHERVAFDTITSTQ